MSAEKFLEQFELLAGTPKALSRFRALILRWAVQGKLVRQDPRDTPAARLIEEAVIRRAELVASRIVRAEEPKFKAVDDGEGALPPGWVSAPLSAYVAVIMGQSPPSTAYNQAGQGLPFYQGKAQFGRLHPTATDWCTEPTKIGEPGDVVISVRAPVGPTNLLRERSCIGRGLASLRSLGGDRLHLLYTLRAMEADLAAKGVGSTFVAISKSDLDGFVIPIPPLAEQKRIVAKVDELMALCDRLEAEQLQREHAHAALTHAALARFADAPAVENLGFLFHQSFSTPPEELRDAVLTLAVQGRLCSQDPRDQAPRVGPVVKGRFEVPDRWRWVAFAAVGEQRLGKMLDQAGNSGTPRPYLRNTNVQWMRFGLDDIKEMRLEDHELDEFRLRDGDLLICEGGEPGRCAIWRDTGKDMFFQKAIHRVRPGPDVLAEYLAINLRIDARNGVLQRHFTGATIMHLTGRSLREYSIPIPPLAEQGRIVAKVNDLMALVDRLEADVVAARAAGERLMDAVVAELTV